MGKVMNCPVCAKDLRLIYSAPPLNPPRKIIRLRIPSLLRHPESIALLIGLCLVALVIVALRWDEISDYALDLLDGFFVACGEVLGGLIPLVILVVLAIIYFIPCMIAAKSPRIAAVFVANLVFGWTVVGWFIVLIWALAEAGSRQPER